MEIVEGVAIDPSEVVWGASDAVVIRRVVISWHTKVKNFSRISVGPKQDFLLHATTIHDNQSTPNLKKKKIN